MNKSRKLIYDKSGGLCWYCGSELEKGWHADHFYPVVRVEGRMLYPELDSIDNKVPSCPSCNMMKSSMPIESFRNTISEFISSLNSYTTQYKFAKKYRLITETKLPVKFWFEDNFKSVKPEHELCNISNAAMSFQWLKDNSEPNYFYKKFDSGMCTIRKIDHRWIAIFMGWGWAEKDRSYFYNGRLVKEKMAEWALSIDRLK